MGDSSGGSHLGFLGHSSDSFSLQLDSDICHSHKELSSNTWVCLTVGRLYTAHGSEVTGPLSVALLLLRCGVVHHSEERQ